MKHYFDMFLKANNRVRNGSRRHSHDPRKATCRNHKWRQSSSLSSISRVTVHFEFIPQDQTVNGAYYWKYGSGYVNLCIEEGPNFGPAIGFSTMTVLQLARHSLSSNLWTKDRLMKWDTHPVSLFWSEWLPSVPEIKSSLKGLRFQDSEDIQEMWRWHWKLFQTGGGKMFPTVADSIVGLSAELLKGSTLKVTPLSNL